VAECREALASIARVVQDVVDRLTTEFHRKDLYMSFVVAFDLDSWSEALAEAHAPTLGEPPAGPSDSARRQRRKLNAVAGRLCATLGVHHCPDAWSDAAQAALAERARMASAVASAADGSCSQKRRRARTAETSWRRAPSAVDTRLVWRRLLDGGRLDPALEPVARLYLATWDGTGAVERGLGQDAGIVGKHVGSRPRTDEEAGLYSRLLELKLDGPQTEQDMYVHSRRCRGAVADRFVPRLRIGVAVAARSPLHMRTSAA
jgi:hypothetical protein